jgi:hypothetical protein
MTGDTTAPFHADVNDPALCAAEARVFAEAALRMLAEGQCEQAAYLLTRAAAFAGAA